MGEQTIGPLLRALREQSGRSQSEQADVLSELSGRAVTRNEVSRWEGQRRLLTPFWQGHYANSFAVSVDQLRRAVAAARAQRRLQPGEDNVPVHRRQFFGVVAGVALPPARGVVLPYGSRIGSADVDQLHRHTARLRRLDDFLGGADTYQLYAANAANTEHLLTAGRFSDADGRRLRSVLSPSNTNWPGGLRSTQETTRRPGGTT